MRQQSVRDAWVLRRCRDWRSHARAGVVVAPRALQGRGNGTREALRPWIIDGAGEIVHETHHRPHVDLDVLDVCRVRRVLLTFLDIDLWLAVGVQLHALEYRHEAFRLRHARGLAHQPIAADGEPFQLSLEACNELIHA